MSVDRQPKLWTIRLGRNFDLSSAPELQKVFVEGLAAGASISVDVEPCGLSVPVLQLVWAAQSGARALGSEVTLIASEQVTRILPFTGFEDLLQYNVPTAVQLPITEEV